MSNPAHIQNNHFDKLSSFETVATSVNLGWQGITVERIRTSPGYNKSHHFNRI